MKILIAFYAMFGLGTMVLYSELNPEADLLTLIFSAILWPAILFHDIWKYIILNLPY